MDYFATYITIVCGKLEEASEYLKGIFNLDAEEGKRGQKRWGIIKQDASWYSPASHRPIVYVCTFDIEAECIVDEMAKRGLVEK